MFDRSSMFNVLSRVVQCCVKVYFALTRFVDDGSNDLMFNVLSKSNVQCFIPSGSMLYQSLLALTASIPSFEPINFFPTLHFRN